MTYHFLKIAPEWLKPVIHREKTFEIRRHDRDFKVWDNLVLMEYADGVYTGRYTIFQVKCIVTHEMFPEGIQEGYCVMGVFKVTYVPPFILHDIAVEQGIRLSLLEVQL